MEQGKSKNFYKAGWEKRDKERFAKAHIYFAGRVSLVFCEGKVRLRVAEVVRRHEV